MSRSSESPSVLGRRMRARREELGWSQEKVGVEIGIDESSSRTRISRYESGIHEPPGPTAKAIARALKVPLAYLYCEDDGVAALLLALHLLRREERDARVRQFVRLLAEGGGTQAGPGRMNR